MKKILVSGANGLLGRALVANLSRSCEVFAVTHTEPIDSRPNVRYVRLDLSDERGPFELPPKLDVVVHLAQSSNFRQFPEKALDIFSVNASSTARLLDYAHRSGVDQFIYFSTGGLYRPQAREIDEDSPLLPIDAMNYYAASKLSGEVFANTYAKLMKTVIVRPFLIYGRGQRRSMLVPRLVDQIKKGEQIFLDGPVGIRVNPVHVEDASAFVTRLVEANTSGLYNMAGPDVLSLKEICVAIGKMLGVDPIFSHREMPQPDLFSSIRKMTDLGCRPRIAFAEGVRDVFDA